MPDVELSVVVPCFNEEESLASTHAHLTKILGAITPSFEIIFVNDGSTDKTGELVRALCAQSPESKFLEFSRNFGQGAAITAGLEFSRGAAVIVMDADLQDPPELIQQMLRLWRDGFDVVYARRSSRKGESLLKKITAAAFYRILNRFAETDLPVDVGEFRLMDRSVVHALLSLGERTRYMRGLVSWLGYRQTSIDYPRAPRTSGATKYSLTRMSRMAGDALFSFSLVPLRAAIWAGSLAATLAIIGIAYALVLRLFTNIWLSGWTLLFIAIAFLGGVQLVFLGVVGEYIGRIFFEVKRRPLYIISDGGGFEPELATRICRRVGPVATSGSADG
jgi:dolichol-phosphate mannosyltransferase